MSKILAACNQIVTVKQMDENFKLETIHGTSFGLVGDYIATNMVGDKSIIPKEEYEKSYVEIRLSRDKINTYKEKELEDMYKNYYSETIENDWKAQEEDWSIMQDTVRDRNKNKKCSG